MNKTIIVALFGKSGAGKDTLLKEVVSKYPDKYHAIVSCTSRPPREGETELDYHFKTREEAVAEIAAGQALEVAIFADWYYYTPYSSIDENKINIGVFNIQGITSLLEIPDIVVLPIFLEVSDKERLIRCLNRENLPNCKEIARRFLVDEEDFKEISFEYKTLYNSNFFISALAEELDFMVEEVVLGENE